MRRAARWLILGVGSLALAGCPMPRPPAEPDVVTVDRPRPPDAPLGSDIVPVDGVDVPLGADADAGSGDDAVVAADVLDFDDFGPDEGLPDVGEDVPRRFDVVVPDVPLATCSMDPGSAGRICEHDFECDMAFERCVVTGCGARRCQPAGRPCGDASDCLAGAQTCTRGYCVPVGTDCGDTRGCPLGFTCEGTAGARRCVDRRVECKPSEPCPYNALCYALGTLSSFCVPMATRCANNAACLPGTTCVDADGDGLRECMPSGCSPSSCTSAPATTCEVSPGASASACGAHGICSATRPCPSGFDCLDAWGTGVSECHARAERCGAHTACAPGQICYPPSPPDAGDSMGGCIGNDPPIMP